MRIAGIWARYGDAERASIAHVANLEYLGEFGEGEAGGTKVVCNCMMHAEEPPDALAENPPMSQL